MQFEVTTVTGIRYKFWNEGEKTFFKKQGAAFPCEVIRFRNETICVGKSIRMDIRDGSVTRMGVTIDTVKELHILS